MTWGIKFPTTSNSSSTHVLERGEPGYDEVLNKLKIGDGSTPFVDLTPIGEAGSGDVIGPDGATNNAVPRFDAATGKLIKNSAVTIDDSGNVTASTFVGVLDGNAETASSALQLTNSRNIILSGDISGSAGFDGTANTTITATLPTVSAAGTYKSVTVNAKGQVTAGTNPTTLAGYGITDAAGSSHNHSGVYQPADTDLTAIAGLAGTSGLLKKTATDTWTLDTTSYITGGNWITYTPTTNATVGTGTLTGSYCRIGNTVFARAKFIYVAGSSSLSSNALYITLPITPLNLITSDGSMSCAGMYSSKCSVAILGDNAVPSMLAAVPQGSKQTPYLRAYSSINSGSPIMQSNWRTNDYVEIIVIYEVSS